MPNTVTQRFTLEIEVDFEFELEGENWPGTLTDPPESQYAVGFAVKDPKTGKALELSDDDFELLEQMATDWLHSDDANDYFLDPPEDYRDEYVPF